jgi:outer membrane biosynthesis protein TonB
MNRLPAALALVAALAACSARAADPKLPDVKAFDKAVIDSLREVHNKGADLYNTSSDHAGAFRIYQGALEAVRPLLAHRPVAQKIIDSGLASAAKEGDIDRKAFVLHETIESVRKQLKVANGFENAPAKKPEEKKPEEKKPEEKKPEDKKPGNKEEKKPVEKKPEEKKPAEKKEAAPMPKAKGDAGSGGKVMVAGKPLAAGEVTAVSTTLPVPRVFTAPVKDGAFRFAEAIPAGRYRAIVTGAGVPAKYHTVTTSGLVLEFASSPANIDLDLK